MFKTQFIFFVFLMSATTTFANVCEISVYTEKNASGVLETKCSDGKTNVSVYPSRDEASKNFDVVFGAFAKGWKNTKCANENPGSKLTCFFEQFPKDPANREAKSNFAFSGPSECEAHQISGLAKAKDDIAMAAVKGFSAGAFGGALASSIFIGGFYVISLPVIFAIEILSFSRYNAQANKFGNEFALIVIKSAFAAGAIGLIGMSIPAWLKYESADKIAIRNAVFFRDLRSDGIGLEIETRAMSILETIKRKDVFFGETYGNIDRLLTYSFDEKTKNFKGPEDNEELKRMVATLRVLPIPEKLISLEMVKSELKLVGEAYMAITPPGDCSDPAKLYRDIFTLTLKQILEKHVFAFRPPAK